MKDRKRDEEEERRAELTSVCSFHASTHTSTDEERERVDARGHEHTSPRANGRRHDRRGDNSRGTKVQTKKEEAREATLRFAVVISQSTAPPRRLATLPPRYPN
ncbi:hypothetical protein PLEOSDRAFT_171168 [Pleurotus ostreatus PC15]|uniref:Uncharacterized protein n=1 Tax=Pleurotus ostreatus (strain PC15) TaxID=1137138 RepID=A0A067N992_PLEO1|nr:hypothetical protein PLEOSDRAFT_171168 [Pleurotus ostreatus PC15]